ncbi:MAG: response regulator [Rubrivivax sp.]
MPQAPVKSHRVALLGFSEFERRTLGSCFRLAGERKTAYVLTKRVDTADFLVADADHKPSVEVVRVTERVSACVFIGSHSPDGALNWMPRPIDPLRVMRELDALVSLVGEPAAAATLMRESAPPMAAAPPLTGSSEGMVDALSQTAAWQAAGAVVADPDAETAPGAFNVPPRAKTQAPTPTQAQPQPGPLDEPPLPHLLRAEWQPETQPGWEPEWPAGWQGSGRGGSPVFVPADDLSSLPAPASPSPSPSPSAPTPTSATAAPAATRLRAPMQAWVDAPSHLRESASMSLTRPQQHPPLSPPPSLPSAGQPMALVVDDSQVAARFLQRRLEAHGVQVTCADNSGDAIALFETHAYDLIFLDVELGPLSALDGLGLCQRVRQSAATVDSSVVLVSAHHSEVDRARGLLAGCDAYLGKPLQESELAQLLSHHGLKAA